MPPNSSNQAASSAFDLGSQVASYRTVKKTVKGLEGRKEKGEGQGSVAKDTTDKPFMSTIARCGSLYTQHTYNLSYEEILLVIISTAKVQTGLHQIQLCLDITSFLLTYYSLF